MHKLACLVFCAAMPALSATVFTDGFEGPTVDPFWTVLEQSGTVSMDSSRTHGGSQSVGFASTSAGSQREMRLRHEFDGPQFGQASVWIYDSDAGQETLYKYLTLNPIFSPTGSSVGMMDFDASCYFAFGPSGSGPNQNCGQYPQVSTTNVTRSAGWHLLEIAYLSTGGFIKIDGQTVHSFQGAHTFTGVDLGMSGPPWRPNTTVNWDDFSISYDTAVPEPSTLGLVSGAAGLFVILRAVRRCRGSRVP